MAQHEEAHSNDSSTAHLAHAQESPYLQGKGAPLSKRRKVHRHHLPPPKPVRPPASRVSSALRRAGQAACFWAEERAQQAQAQPGGHPQEHCDVRDTVALSSSALPSPSAPLAHPEEAPGAAEGQRRQGLWADVRVQNVLAPEGAQQPAGGSRGGCSA